MLHCAFLLIFADGSSVAVRDVHYIEVAIVTGENPDEITNLDGEFVQEGTVVGNRGEIVKVHSCDGCDGPYDCFMCMIRSEERTNYRLVELTPDGTYYHTYIKTLKDALEVASDLDATCPTDSVFWVDVFDPEYGWHHA